MDSLLQTIFNLGALVSGSFVREHVVRRVNYPLVGGPCIDIIVPEEKRRELLHFLVEDLACFIIPLEEKLCYAANCQFFLKIIPEQICSYFQFPDFDVNTLVWDGRSIYSWSEFTSEDELFYGVSLKSRAIIERCRRKEARALWCNWVGNNKEITKRMESLNKQGWTVV